MQKQYRVRTQTHDDLITDLLHARGIQDPEAQNTFLMPNFERDSHDPFLLPDMEKAVERILAALRFGEKVCVWSDYDCDGIPGGVLLTEFLRSIGLEVVHYIPHRHNEGYGLNLKGLQTLADEHIKLVITVDLGITDVEAVEFAASKGMDVIITDHHLVPPQMPPAYAVVDPKRIDSAYPFDGLCGAGVAWKLVQAVLQKHRPEGYSEGREKWLLDLAGIATLSDMVPLVDENRMLAYYGLRVLRRNRRPGFAALLSLLKIKAHTLTEDDVGFMVSPRINAASRMDSPQLAARLLAATDVGEAKELAQQLDGINTERKTLVATTVKEVTKRLSEAGNPSPVIVMGSPHWRPGILGLVANSLAETHSRPVFLWGREGGELLRGSCRSDDVVNIVELMRGAGDIFDDFGGHYAAGGFSITQDKVHELGPRLEKAFEALQKTAGVKEIVVDRELRIAEVPHAQRAIMQLAPFGMNNEKPLFLIPNTTVAAVRIFGKKQDHLELRLAQGADFINAIAFFSTPESFQKTITKNMRADVVGHVEYDWRGVPRVRIVDVL